jgi:uncharacterized membrane protein
MDPKNLNRHRLAHRIYGLTAVGTILWLAALFAAPWLRSRASGAAAYLYACFSPFCHQNPARSFIFWGYPLAVCARCFGVYAGFAGGLLLYPFLRRYATVGPPRLRTLIAVSIPIVFDTGANLLGLWDTPGIIRFLTGFMWGLILPFYFLTGLIDLFSSREPGTSQNSARSESTHSSSDRSVTPQ